MANAVNYTVFHEDGSLTHVDPWGHILTYTATHVLAAYDTLDDWEQQDVVHAQFDWLSPRCALLAWAIPILQRWGRGTLVRRRLRPYRAQRRRPLRRFERDEMDPP